MKYDPVTERKITNLAARLLVAWWGSTETPDDEADPGWESDTVRRMFEIAEVFNEICEERKSQ